ncbi:MAG: undecaprenyl-phosphate galactose phosphotransferase WbaP, partial [Anaerolineaceae bacterium]|nr:undecaprenyl-phosphate galactose phosphotransferase WbaP [Anaerolineaceae bacterium]
LSTLIRQLLIPLMGGSVNWPLILQGLLFYVPFTIILAWLTGLYPGLGLASVQEMQKVLYVVTLSSIFLGILLFFQKLGPSYSRLIFVMTWFLSVAMILGARFGLRKNCSRYSWWGIPLIVVGSPENTRPVISMLLRNRRLGLKPVYAYDPNGNDNKSIKGIPSITDKDSLIKAAGEASIHYVVFTDRLDTDLNSDIYWMRDIFPHMLFILSTPTISTLWSHTIDLHGTLLVGTDYRLLNKTERLIKFIIDKLLTILLILVSWPLYILLALLVRLSSKGPVLYTQKRLGLGEKEFNSYKFRTMYQNAEEKLNDLLAKDPLAAEEYEHYHKLANDPRITWMGRFLRRYSLDEFPQLINVLKGDMNLIGPRSYLPRELPDMGQHAKIILTVKPGLTGWWQVMGRNATTFQERLLLDEYYISNWSIWLDIYIAIKTVWVVLSGQGL